MLKIITSESVNCGHPDKTCDIIADSFLDCAYKQDKNAQMAVECAIKDDLLMIYGEATTTANIDYEKIATDTLAEIGYKNKFRVIQQISKQSPDINQAVVKKEICANDQGIMFGYATNENSYYMPYPILIAHKLMKVYDAYRRKTACYFADAKSQVSIAYDGNKPVSIHTILLSVSHAEELTHQQIENDMQKNVIQVVLKEFNSLDQKNINYVINPSGKFTIWGSFGDSGCVGRKIVVDTYGGVGKVGGGCFSSKNATKVDRSGAYYARYVAKNIVAHKMADICEVSLSYAIGLPNPLSVCIKTFGTNHINKQLIYKYVEENFNFSVKNIIKELDLQKPVYKQTACFGHFGNPNYSWEKIKPIKNK